MTSEEKPVTGEAEAGTLVRAGREGIPGADVPLTAGMVIGALTGRADDLRQSAQRAYKRAGSERGRVRRGLEDLGRDYMDRSLDLRLVAERVQDLALESLRD